MDRAAELCRACRVRPPEERFWEKVEKTDGCWNWTAARFDDGYGAFRMGAQQCRAHRVSLMFSGVTLGPGQQALHSCHNRLCVRPEHLRAGTHLENMADMRRAGRSARPRGEANAMAVLTADQVVAMREAYALGGTSAADLAPRFGITTGAAAAVVTGRVWAHAGGPIAPRGACRCRFCGAEVKTRSSHEKRCARATTGERAFFAANRKWPEPPRHRHWKQREPSRCARLRELLADGLWHDMKELRHAGGWRYGARLLSLRTGSDGEASLLIENRPVDGDSSHWEYRFTGPNPSPRPKPTPKVRRCCPSCGQRLRMSPDATTPAPVAAGTGANSSEPTHKEGQP